MLANKTFMKNVDAMIDGAKAGISASAGNKKAVEFNSLSLEMFKAMKSGNREDALDAANKLVKAGHGAAFGL